MIVLCCIAMLVGLIKGMIDRLKELRLAKKTGVKPPPVFVPPTRSNNLCLLREQLAAMETGPPPEALDKIQALEYSADVIRKEIELLEGQLRFTFDPSEQVKLHKKLAACYKRQAAEYDKINKIKNKYCVL